MEFNLIDYIIKSLPYVVMVFSIPLLCNSLLCYRDYLLCKDCIKTDSEEFIVIKKRRKRKNGNVYYSLDTVSKSGRYKNTLNAHGVDEYNSYDINDSVGLCDVYTTEKKDGFYRVVKIGEEKNGFITTELINTVAFIFLAFLCFLGAFVLKTMQ